MSHLSNWDLGLSEGPTEFTAGRPRATHGAVEDTCPEARVGLPPVVSARSSCFTKPDIFLNLEFWRSQLPSLSIIQLLRPVEPDLGQHVRLPELPEGARLTVFAHQWLLVTADPWVLDALTNGLRLEFQNSDFSHFSFKPTPILRVPVKALPLDEEVSSSGKREQST